jgi:PhoH-like ATPase
MTKKTFVIDTNVLLYDPDAIFKFSASHIAIPVTVLEELDSMKRLPNELGKNARAVFRTIDKLIAESKKDLHSKLPLDNGSDLRILLEIHSEGTQSLSLKVNDNRIILTAYELQERGEKVVFVSKDLAARIKAGAIGLQAQDYKNLKYDFQQIYKGINTCTIPKHDIDLFYKDAAIPSPIPDLRPNEYCMMTSPENSSAVGKFDVASGNIVPMLKTTHLWGIKPRNLEQRCAVDLLMRDDIKLVTLLGQAGTGKTLLALACGMRKVFDDGTYNRILISRPIVPLGRDIGYLPGTKEEKLFPWMQPIYDNLSFLCDSSGKEPNDTLKWLMDSNKIIMEALAHVRGRSLPNTYIIIDEAQNLTPHEVKTIISRAGEGTKVILTGDPTQIDNPYLDKDSNGLTYLVARFSEYAIYGHVLLSRTERSELAALAAAIL